jgi:hypothetical protein
MQGHIYKMNPKELLISVHAYLHTQVQPYMYIAIYSIPTCITGLLSAQIKQLPAHKKKKLLHGKFVKYKYTA